MGRDELVCPKGFAALVKLHPRTLKRWLKHFGIKPTIPGHASHRYNYAKVEEFKRRWKKETQTAHGKGTRSYQCRKA